MNIFNIDIQNYSRDNLLPLPIENENESNMALLYEDIQNFINDNNINKEFSICLKDLCQRAIVAFCLLKTNDNGIDNSVKIEALGYCDDYTLERISNQTLSQSCFGGNYDSVWYQNTNTETLPRILNVGFVNLEGNIKQKQFIRNEQ